jgi:acetylornithine deacetylase/succinyl-diaminopimelate desuccinylase-like protein
MRTRGAGVSRGRAPAAAAEDLREALASAAHVAFGRPVGLRRSLASVCLRAGLPLPRSALSLSLLSHDASAAGLGLSAWLVVGRGSSWCVPASVDGDVTCRVTPSQDVDEEVETLMEEIQGLGTPEALEPLETRLDSDSGLGSPASPAYEASRS